MNRNVVITCKILQKEIGLTDAEYRAILWSKAGVNSSKDLVGESAHRVIQALESLKPEKVKPAPKVYDWMKPKKERPWNWVTATDEQWNRMGELIYDYAAKDITVVAVMGIDGTRKFKWRNK